MLAILIKQVWWLGMARRVLVFCKAYDVYNRIKSTTEKTQGLSKPLPIPNSKFQSWSIELSLISLLLSTCDTLKTAFILLLIT